MGLSSTRKLIGRIGRKAFYYITAPTKLRIGEVEIQTTPGHPLHEYLRAIPLYDRFLGHLCSSFEAGDVVIDIGANIGDTAASIVNANSGITLVCVEPDQRFFDLLKTNADKLRRSTNDIRLIQAFIWDTNENIKIVKNSAGSTGHAIHDISKGATEIPTLTYEELLTRVGSPVVKLVKIDTDGFDYKILNAMRKYYEADPKIDRPLIFFELQTYLNDLGFNDPLRSERKTLYMNVIKDLMERGWDRYIVFDNFGAPMISGTDPDLVDQLIDYCFVCQTINDRVTAYFYDVLLFPNEFASLVNQGLTKHLRRHLSSESGLNNT